MVVFALIGYFLIKAALDYDPDKAIGLDGALAHLGAGLLRAAPAGHRRRRPRSCFGAYSIADARYRKV